MGGALNRHPLSNRCRRLQGPPPVIEPPEPAADHIAQLTDMGFAEPVARKALILAKDNVNVALEWLFEHAEDADAAEPPTQEQLRQVWWRQRVSGGGAGLLGEGGGGTLRHLLGRFAYITLQLHVICVHVHALTQYKQSCAQGTNPSHTVVCTRRFTGRQGGAPALLRTGCVGSL